MPDQNSLLRAALLVALAAVLEATLSPFLAFGPLAPRFVPLSIVVATSGLREPQALLLGFFGGVLTDALSGGLFGVGALSGLAAATASVRLGTSGGRKGGVRAALARATVVAVVVYDLLGRLALELVGREGPPVGGYVLWGVLPNALLNGLLALILGGLLLRFVAKKKEADTWA